MKKLYFFIALFAFFSSHATVYYISPSGNDATGTGSITNPWKTLFKACNTVAGAGDIIHVNAGTYTETAQCALKPGVSIEGDNQFTSILRSSLTGAFTPMLILASAEGTNGNQHIYNCRFEGQLTTQWGVLVSGRSNVEIANCRFYDFFDVGVAFRGRTDFNDGPPTTYSSGNSFHHNYMWNNATIDDSYGRGNLEVGGQVGMLIYNDTIIQTARAIGFNGYCIKNINQGFLKGMKIYNNYLEVNPYPYFSNGAGNNRWDFATEFSDLWGLEVYNNRIKGSCDQNFQRLGNGYTYSVYYHDNIFGWDAVQANPQSGIILEYKTETGIIENNTFKNITYPFVFTPRHGDTISNLTIRKNLAYGIGTTSDGQGQAVRMLGFYDDYQFNWKIHNNTFLAHTNNPAWGVDVPAGLLARNISVVNNIVRGFSAGDLHVYNGSGIDTLEIKNNNYIKFYLAGTPAHYTNSGNTTVLPNLNGAYQPNAGSPMIDGGINVGLAFNGSAPDVGYYETGSTLPNLPPTANAGPDQAITLPLSLITLSGSGNDPDGTIVSYQWTKISGPAAGTITTPLAALTTVTALVQGVYKFELKVTDNGGATAVDTMQVTVNAAANIPPTANAGPDQNITLPTSTVSLSGSGVDPDGSITAYQWTKISGPTSGTITSATTAATTVTGLVQGVYQFELRVTDNSGAFGRDTMQVTVNPAGNIPPTANAGPDQTITLPTSTVSLSGSGVDPDGSITAYQWTKISGPAAGTITSATNAATTVTGLVQGIYKFELRVTDNSGAFGRDTMQVTVNAAANIPPTANAGPDQNITLPTSTVSLSGSGVDPDGSITAYQWTKISGPAAGTITSATNAATTVTGLVQGIYKFELRVTDNGGAFGRDTMQVTVNAAANIPPTANAGPDQIITLPTSTVSLSGSGIDPDGSITAYQWTKISGPAAGTITSATSAATTVTGLAQGIYQFELRVADNSGAFGRDTMQVTVNPAPNIPPIANAGNDQVITLPTNSTNLSGSGIDPDGSITAYQWTKISGPAAGTIANAANPITAISGLAAGTYKFELRVTDNSGAFDTDTVQVIVNVPPVANAGTDVSITLPINTASLSGNGTDIDGSVVAYAWTKISGPNAGTITNASSAATTVTGLIAGIYRYELLVTDNYGATGRDTVQVIVFAPNIPPVANAGLDQSLTLPTNSITLTGSGTDVDGTVIGFLWTKIAGPAANITSPATAVTAVTGLIAGTYYFELRVTDNNGGTDRDTVRIIVNPENIPPVANAGPDQVITLPTSTITLSGRGTDVDGTVVAYKWKQILGPVDKLTAPNNPVTVLDNMIEGAYKFELTVTDNKGATGKDTVAVTVKPMTVTTMPNTIKIYPNPITDLATLEINKDNNGAKVLVVITDMTGKTVYKQQYTPGAVVTKQTLDFSRFAKGTYLVTVDFNAGDKITVKAIKQ